MLKPLGCLIEPDRVAEVGSQVVGLVERLNVERGDSVAAGQPLLTLRADVERANASAAGTRSRVDADVLAAKAGFELAQQKMRRAETLVAQNFVSDQAVEQARGEAEVARQKLSQVRGQQRVWVEERPLMRVAVIDPLRVELMVPTAQYGSLATGDRVTIRPELPGAEAVVATVRHVDRVLDAASNTFRVRLTLPNPNFRLPAGLRCKADLPVATVTPAPVAPARPAAAVERQRPLLPARGTL